MKTLKRFLVSFMCVLMLVSATAVFASAAAAKAQPKVKETTVSTATLTWSKVKNADGYRVYKVVDGKLSKITDTKKTSYKIKNLVASDSYKFAVRHYTVNKKGKLSLAKEYGTVTAKTKALSKVSNFTATPENNSVSFKWDKLAGASGYRIEVKNAEGKWEKVKSLSVSDISYKASFDTGFNKYTFRIRGYSKTAKGTVWGPAATCKTELTLSGKTAITNATSTLNSITISWKQIEGADGYRVYSYINGEYVILDRTYGGDNTTYTVKDLDSDSNYTFAVKAFSKKGDKTAFALISDSYTVHTEKANLDVYRAEMIKDILGAKEFYIEYSEMHPTYGRVDSVMALRMGKLYLKETVKGVSTVYILNTANNHVTVMNVNNKTYRTAAESEELYILLAALRDIMNIENMGEVKVSYKSIDGVSLICESFTESKYGRYMELYFADEHTLAGIYTKYADGSESTVKVTRLEELAEPTLFDIPMDYRAE